MLSGRGYIGSMWLLRWQLQLGQLPLVRRLGGPRMVYTMPPCLAHLMGQGRRAGVLCFAPRLVYPMPPCCVQQCPWSLLLLPALP